MQKRPLNRACTVAIYFLDATKTKVVYNKSIIWWLRRQYGWILHECAAIFSRAAGEWKYSTYMYITFTFISYLFFFFFLHAIPTSLFFFNDISFLVCVLFWQCFNLFNILSYMWSQHCIKCNHNTITWKAELTVNYYSSNSKSVTMARTGSLDSTL